MLPEVVRSDPVSLCPDLSWAEQPAGHGAGSVSGSLFLTESGEIGFKYDSRPTTLRPFVPNSVGLNSTSEPLFQLPLFEVMSLGQGTGLIEPTALRISAAGDLYTASFVGFHARRAVKFWRAAARRLNASKTRGGCLSLGRALRPRPLRSPGAHPAERDPAERRQPQSSTSPPDAVGMEQGHGARACGPGPRPRPAPPSTRLLRS